MDLGGCLLPPGEARLRRNKSLKCRVDRECDFAPHVDNGCGVFAYMYLDLLKKRVLVFDGAMGTSIQALGLSAADFGGAGLDGCNDYLVITRPDAIESIHASYLAVGADVLETNTFRSNPLTRPEDQRHGKERRP